MKSQLFSFRLSPNLAAQVCRDAQRHGVSRSTWTAHLVERGLAADALDKLVGSDNVSGAPTANGLAAMPPEIARRIVFAACFAEAILKKLNASLNRSSSELGVVASQARDQAEAETATLLESLYGTPGG